VAQVGSVIGRGFSYALLRAVTGIEDAPDSRHRYASDFPIMESHGVGLWVRRPWAPPETSGCRRISRT
jgi:hypothetical protein